VRIKARMGMSLDGYVATTDGTPALIMAGGFVPSRSHGYPEFIDGCDTVVMGRRTFLPALDARTGRGETCRFSSSPPAPCQPGRPHASLPPPAAQRG
jgi:hypothetical protein